MRKLFSIMMLAGAFSFINAPSHACTGIKLTAKDGSIVAGRTLEFGLPVQSSVAVVPRGYTVTGTTPSGKGMTYKTKYAAVGTICFDSIAIMDGMNEKGLAAGTFYFPGFAGYSTITPENQSKALSPTEFPSWIISQFATLDEVKAALSDVVISPTVVNGWGSTPPPFHYIVYDSKGNAITIEPINGKLVITDNPLGVFTNSPTFDWHMINLGNYLNLSVNNASPKSIEGVKLTPYGQGSGLVGMPGDFTPPSRFVRAAIFAASAVPSANSTDAVFQAFHILNQFDIPAGAVRSLENGKTYDDVTLATVVRDPGNLKYYFRTYDDQTIKVVDLKKFDLDGKEIQASSTSGRQGYVDVSNELKPLIR